MVVCSAMTCTGAFSRWSDSAPSDDACCREGPLEGPLCKKRSGQKEPTRLGEVDFVGESGGAALPIEVKSVKTYRRHVALDNLMRSPEHGKGRALFYRHGLCSLGGKCFSKQREGGVVHYLSLYMLSHVAAELGAGSLAGVMAPPPSW